MGKRKYDDEQITGILKEHQEGMTVTDVCHKYGISEPTSYRWQSLQLRSVGVDARKLKALEEENQKLKKLLADAMLTAATLSEMLEQAASKGRP
jgi:putative transposase